MQPWNKNQKTDKVQLLSDTEILCILTRVLGMSDSPQSDHLYPFPASSPQGENKKQQQQQNILWRNVRVKLQA